MGEHDAAQAVVLIRALSDVRDKMISQVNWLEKHDSQLDARALRRDIHEAQAHIIGLQRRYLGGAVQAAQPDRGPVWMWEDEQRHAWNQDSGTAIQSGWPAQRT